MSARVQPPQERQERIRKLLTRERYVSVRDLADQEDVSDMTIRRDLEALAERGHVRRVFGGAHVPEATAVEQVYIDRMHQNREAKEAIAERAVQEISDGDTVALDGSTTSVYLARCLAGRDVVVVTTSLLVAQELVDADMEVVLPGGVLRSRTLCLVGPVAERNLSDFHVDTVFFSTGGLHPTHGLTDTHDLEAAVKRSMFEIGGRLVALIDSSKFGRKALHPLTPLERIDMLVTEAPPAEEIAAALARQNVRVEVADG